MLEKRDLCFEPLALSKYVLKIKISKNEKMRMILIILLNGLNFLWNEIISLYHICISLRSQSTNIRALAKGLVLTTRIFPASRLNKFFNFLNRNILFLECSKKDQIYISDILTLFEYMLRIKN